MTPDAPTLTIAQMRLIIAQSVARLLGGAWTQADADGKPYLVTWDNEPSQNAQTFARLRLVSCVDEEEPSEVTDPITFMSTIRVTKRAQIDAQIESTDAQQSENTCADLVRRIGRVSERLILEALGVVVIEKPKATQDLSYDDRESGERVSVTGCEFAIRYNERELDTSRVAQRAKAVGIEGTAAGVPITIQSPNYPN